MGAKHGNLSINSDNIFPIIKKWLYSDHDIFVRELVSNGCDAITKFKKLEMMGEYTFPDDYKNKIVGGGLPVRRRRLHRAGPGLPVPFHALCGGLQPHRRYLAGPLRPGAVHFHGRRRRRAVQHTRRHERRVHYGGPHPIGRRTPYDAHFFLPQRQLQLRHDEQRDDGAVCRRHGFYAAKQLFSLTISIPSSIILDVL